uniref:Uncharacterized protein n=1 Tax=Bionectria ochroleuca TaxID=29856 RepID=A0A8H7N3X9_BIOOC
MMTYKNTVPHLLPRHLYWKSSNEPSWTQRSRATCFPRRSRSSQRTRLRNTQTWQLMGLPGGMNLMVCQNRLRRSSRRTTTTSICTGQLNGMNLMACHPEHPRRNQRTTKMCTLTVQILRESSKMFPRGSTRRRLLRTTMMWGCMVLYDGMNLMGLEILQRKKSPRPTLTFQAMQLGMLQPKMWSCEGTLKKPPKTTRILMGILSKWIALLHHRFILRRLQRRTKISQNTNPQKFDSPDENRPIHPEEASKEYKDLGKYSASFEEAETLERTHPEQLTKQYKDLDKYAPQSFDPANKTYLVHSEEATKAYKDLHLYGTVSHNEPDGLPGKHQDPTSQGLGPYDSKVRAEQEKTLTMGRHWGQANRMSSSTLEDSMDSLDNLTAQDIRADVLRKVQETRQNETLDSAKAEHESSWDATTNQARDQIHDAKTKNTHRLTGNYIQDFSEDFARSWSTENSSTGAALFPKDLSGGDGNHSSSAKSSSVEPEDEPDLESMDGCFPTETFRPEPALNRQLSKKGRNKLNNSATNATVAGTGAGHLATSETGQMPDSEAESFATSQQSENPSRHL